jgi:ATPase family associated with various cellular activities (AAA).
MGRAISNKNIEAAVFESANFEGDWLASFGRPELRGSWIVYGGSGAGKTTFMLQLAKYLCLQDKRVAYDSLEQGLSLSFKTAWERCEMIEVGSKFILTEKEGVKEIWDRLAKRRSQDVMIIDSIHYLLGFKMADYMKLVKNFPNKLFIFVAHEKNRQPQGSVAQYIRYNSDVKIRVEGYKAFITTRYEDTARGEGGKDFVIWRKGADRYWNENL